MKIVIAHASAGTGHLKAAEALARCLENSYPDAEVRVTDTLDFSGVPYRFVYRSGYALLVKYAPWLWAAIFQLTAAKPFRKVAKAFNLFADRLNARSLAEFFIRKNPDIIVSTHFVPPEIAGYLRKKKLITSRLVTVITDFGVHPFWLNEGTDIYIAASDFTKRKLLSFGIKESSIRVSGIPVDPKFLKSYDAGEICRRLAIEKEKFTVLIASGSFGIGPIEEIIASLRRDAQLLVVCANNKELYRRLKSLDYSGVKVFGFIDNIQELMAVSQVIIGKPGGLTISESLAMGLYPVFITAIPGQESENIKALAAEGVGVYVTEPVRIRDLILDLKNDPRRLAEARENIKRIRRPYAAKEICDAVCQGSFRPAD